MSRRAVHLLQLIAMGWLCMALTACANSAPPVPVDTTGTNRETTSSLSDFSADDAAMNCSAITAEMKANADKIETDNAAIRSNRKNNEIAGYLGGLLILPYAATESNSAEKEDIKLLQSRQDVLRKLLAFKKCPA